MPKIQVAMRFGYLHSIFRPFSCITAKQWIKNDDDFDIGVKNGMEHDPGKFMPVCS